jgi:hypothetical protein
MDHNQPGFPSPENSQMPPARMGIPVGRDRPSTLLRDMEIAKKRPLLITALEQNGIYYRSELTQVLIAKGKKADSLKTKLLAFCRGKIYNRDGSLTKTAKEVYEIAGLPIPGIGSEHLKVKQAPEHEPITDSPLAEKAPDLIKRLVGQNFVIRPDLDPLLIKRGYNCYSAVSQLTALLRGKFYEREKRGKEIIYSSAAKILAEHVGLSPEEAYGPLPPKPVASRKPKDVSDEKKCYDTSVSFAEYNERTGKGIFDYFNENWGWSRKLKSNGATPEKIYTEDPSAFAALRKEYAAFAKLMKTFLDTLSVQERSKWVPLTSSHFEWDWITSRSLRNLEDGLKELRRRGEGGPIHDGLANLAQVLGAGNQTVRRPTVHA